MNSRSESIRWLQMLKLASERPSRGPLLLLLRLALVVPGEVEFLATNAVAPIALQAGATAPQGPEEATPETLAAIGATITAVLGKEVRIRSAKTPQTPSATPNPWARQGRVIVQASHDLRPPRALTTPERHATSSSGGGDLKRSAQ